MRAALLSLALLACDKSGGDSGDPLAGLILVEEDPPDSPLAGLDEDWAERFALGDAAFEVAFRESQGLGPAYIRASCASCPPTSTPRALRLTHPFSSDWQYLLPKHQLCRSAGRWQRVCGEAGGGWELGGRRCVGE
jgi:hypothetical protein